MKYVWLVLCCWLLAACSIQPSIPVYPTIDSTIPLDDPRLQSVVAAFWTTDSATDVRAWYLDAMTTGGWVNSADYSLFLVFHAKNDPDTTISIRIEEQGLTVVMIGERFPVNFAATRQALDPASPSSTPEPPDLPAATAYTKRWLQKLPCAAPCWEGVTPGTTVTDTLAILKQTPGILPSSVSTSTWPEANTGYVIWRWQGSDHSNEALYDLDTNQQVVSVIRPYFEYVPNADETFRFHEVIAAYGEPSHIRVEEFFGDHGDGPFYVIEIVYAEQGFSIEQRHLNKRKFTLDDQIIFDRVTFYALPYTIDSASMVPWEGLKEFDYYCRNTSNDGNACEP